MVSFLIHSYSNYVSPLSFSPAKSLYYSSHRRNRFCVLLTGEIDSPFLSLASPSLHHSHSHLHCSVTLTRMSFHHSDSQISDRKASSPCVFSVHLLRVISLVLRVSSPRFCAIGPSKTCVTLSVQNVRSHITKHLT
ncbi:hypothetical protein RIF29_29834 [Crotalaria pallida]|uniref:Uncharacterized protein n=1 Tax=Crotalaria pallida TaxID=3830 RepID=A0AAN9I0S0_CROPI